MSAPFAVSLDTVARRLRHSGPMFGAGWEEASMPNWLLQQSWEEVYDWYIKGVVTQSGWEAYAHVWAQSAGRFTTFADAYRPDPVDDEVIALVSILRQQLRYGKKAHHVELPADA